VDFIRNFDETIIFSNIQNTKGCVGFNNQYTSTESNSDILNNIVESVNALQALLNKNNELLLHLKKNI
jgi:hypothetical protein